MDFVKAITGDDGEWMLDVLGIPYGGPNNGKDSDGEFFDAKTELWLDQIGKRAVVHYHGYDQGGEQASKPEVIGQELSYEVKDDGVWFRILLDKTKEIARQIWESAQTGMARASSGALSHLVRTDHQTGHIEVWPTAEISLMNMNAGNYPANPYAVALPAMRALFKAANLQLPEDLNEQSEPDNGPELKENLKMTDEVKNFVTAEDLTALLDKRDAAKAEQDRIAELEAQAEELKAMKAEIADAKAERETEGRGQVKKLGNPAAEPEKEPVIEVNTKWDGFSLGELGFAYEALKATKSRIPMQLYRTLHAKAEKKVNDPNYYADLMKRDSNGQIVREFSPVANAEAAAAVKAVKPMQMADNAIKANELMGSDVTDQGDEWVPAMWTPELWDMVRNDARVLPRFRQVEVPGESLTIPALEGKTTVYKVAQLDSQSQLDLPNAAATMTQFTTGQTTLTPVKSMAWLGFTEELNEDSIVPILSMAQQSLAKDLAEQLDEIVISGDTDTANTNNSDTGNGSISAAWHLLIANGLRDYALENSKASDRGALAAEDFLAVMGLMGTNGAYALDPEKLMWVMDPGVYRKALALGETITADKAGGIGTFQNGRLMKIFGSDVVVSDKYALTDANGQIHNTAGNNTLGSFLCVRPDRWVAGFGRRVKIESPPRGVTEIVTDTRHLVASFRFDFKYHPAANGAALGYNVTV